MGIGKDDRLARACAREGGLARSYRHGDDVRRVAERKDRVAALRLSMMGSGSCT